MRKELKRQGEGPERKAAGNISIDSEGLKDRDTLVTEGHVGRPLSSHHKRRKPDLLG